MTVDVSPGKQKPRRDYRGMVFVAVLAALEIGLLYVLIAVESPLTPAVTALLRNPFGIFVLVMLVVTLLGYGMASVLRLLETKSSAVDDSRSG
jgi:succinate dehydrogenase hydrophobic anchor subunit